MKLFDFYIHEDFGKEFIFTLLKHKRYSFLQFSFQWNDYGDSFYLQIGIGNRRLIDVLFWFWRIGFSLEILGYTWNYNRY